jgi:hypothetical protein
MQHRISASWELQVDILPDGSDTYWVDQCRTLTFSISGELTEGYQLFLVPLPNDVQRVTTYDFPTQGSVKLTGALPYPDGSIIIPLVSSVALSIRAQVEENTEIYIFSA